MSLTPTELRKLKQLEALRTPASNGKLTVLAAKRTLSGRNYIRFLPNKAWFNVGADWFQTLPLTGNRRELGGMGGNQWALLVDQKDVESMAKSAKLIDPSKAGLYFDRLDYLKKHAHAKALTSGEPK